MPSTRSSTTTTTGSDADLSPSPETPSPTISTPIGHLTFPFYTPDNTDHNDKSWMKRVHLYVGKNQRLAGEVKKLAKPFGVLRKRVENKPDTKPGSGVTDIDMGTQNISSTSSSSTTTSTKENENGNENEPKEELEILDIIEYRILFSARPEPVGD
ncbi:putative sister chromatid cohesion protein ctf8 [Phaeomoniella chlamydospora]|uniref:Putative sister chromatid cohesion protein ctf8 n=1 Tax=Phaeomoniella chlamydospora TaxID=158046 RepID=A0A0G2DR07_PHACM|nr:putative sister chromatid cohesion protein ctf8 [Phaeomoniella chlamydospora]